MLDIQFNRRDWLRIGAIGAGLTAMNLHDPVLAEAVKKNNKSIIWVWLGGGPTHFELWNARIDVPSDPYLPVPINNVRMRYNSKYDVKLGGGFAELSKHIDKLNVVANFSHSDSSHRQATHWMNTAHYNPERATTADAKYPSHGAIVSAVHGTSTQAGVPTYVAQNRIEGDGAAWLGGAYKGFDPRSKDNLTPRVDVGRFQNRRDLLAKLDAAQIQGAQALDSYKGQAFDTILGDAKSAFSDTGWDKAKEQYGDTSVGKQLWMAGKLAKHGSKFVTLHYGGWDMHSNIQAGLEQRIPPLDQGLAALLNDLGEQLDDVLIVVTGEFGRTRLNANQGRDHWPALTPLLLMGGEYESGRVIGESDRQNYSPEGNKFGPIDLQATMFHHVGIDEHTQRVDNSGRPRYLLEGEHRVIL